MLLLVLFLEILKKQSFKKEVSKKYQCILLNSTYNNSVTNNNKELFLTATLGSNVGNMKMEEFIMASRNRVTVPEAREAMNRFKYEVANEIGVPLKQGYNGDLTSYQNGSVGGMMVKKMIAEQQKRMAGQ
jgi:hypothetical protein